MIERESTMIDNERLAAISLRLVALDDARYSVLRLPADVQAEVARRLVTPGVSASAVAAWLKAEGHPIANGPFYRFATALRAAARDILLRAAMSVADATSAGIPYTDATDEPRAPARGARG